MSDQNEWTQQRQDDYADGYEFARQELLANGERVEWCEEHGGLEAVEEDPGVCWRYDGDKPCRIVSKLLSDHPKEAE